MPYTRNAERKFKRHIITLPQLTKTNWQVTTEMERLGLWTTALDDVEVWLVPLSYACYGWFHEKGHIYIPAVGGASLSDLIAGRHTRLGDVLRHEWAHALADRRPEFVNHPRFTRTFGDPYHSAYPVYDYDPAHHVTPYAAVMPCEDFAEIFHFYLRHKGRIPTRLAAKPKIVKKWKFIAWMAREIRRNKPVA